MGCNSIGKARIGSGGEVDAAALSALLFEPCKQRAVVGEMGHVERNVIRDLRLQRGFAIEDPAEGFEGACRIGAQQDEQRIDQRIALDERAVEVNAQGAQQLRIGLQLSLCLLLQRFTCFDYRLLTYGCKPFGLPRRECSAVTFSTVHDRGI